MTDRSGVPALVPARMLNEFLYCRRLFHLEWVQGEFVDNEETVEGRSLHRRVDDAARSLPSPDALDDGVAARSVLLDAPRLGMVARIDLVEGADGAVSPVERKRGRPRADGTVWEPEELQLVAQALILRENGYRVAAGYVSYPQLRERIRIEITPEREARLRRALQELRVVAGGPMPPPLVDSPKCPRCSLVGICLPDETHLLRADAVPVRPVRRLLVPADDAAALYVQEQGATVGRRGGRVEVRRADQLLMSVRLLDVAHLSVYGNVMVTPAVLRALCEAGAPVTHHTYGGWLVGVTSGPGHRNAELRIRQFATAADPERALALARGFVDGKVRNQRTLLRRNHRGDVDGALRDLTRMGRRAGQAESAASLLGFEGVAARSYFGSFQGLLAGRSDLRGFSFEGRNRRPPRDPVNALLSFTYGLLVREATAAVLRTGLDPYVGFFHEPRYGRPALALDLAEEFRPIVADSVVVGVINNGQVRPSDFVVRAGAYALRSDGRKALIEAFERRMATLVRHPLFGYRVSYRRVVELQARLLARVLTGELPAYRPFVTR